MNKTCNSKRVPHWVASLYNYFIGLYWTDTSLKSSFLGLTSDPYLSGRNSMFWLFSEKYELFFKWNQLENWLTYLQLKRNWIYLGRNTVNHRLGYFNCCILTSPVSDSSESYLNKNVVLSSCMYFDRFHGHVIHCLKSTDLKLMKNWSFNWTFILCCHNLLDFVILGRF